MIFCTVIVITVASASVRMMPGARASTMSQGWRARPLSAPRAAESRPTAPGVAVEGKSRAFMHAVYTHRPDTVAPRRIARTRLYNERECRTPQREWVRTIQSLSSRAKEGTLGNVVLIGRQDFAVRTARPLPAHVVPVTQANRQEGTR